MTRVKRGVTKHQRHKKVLGLTKGHETVRHRQYRRARESLLHALSHAYRHRRERKRDARRLWILRINAAARAIGLSYSSFVHGLKLEGINLNRKVLAGIAVRDTQAFADLADLARTHLQDPMHDELSGNPV